MSSNQDATYNITQEDLEALVVANNEFADLEASIGIFCPFEAIGMVRQEIRHGNFLTYYLDPQRPHGFGSECLRALMRAAADEQRRVSLNSTTTISPIDVHLMELESAELRREWRRVDVLAIIPEEKLIVAIELKIDASEGTGQLAQYRRVVQEQWPNWRYLFIFLTKRGEDASEDYGDGWLSLPLEALASQFEKLITRQVGTIDARHLLAAYIAMLRRHHLTNEKLEVIAGKLWSQHRQALEFLMARRPDAGEGLFGELFEKREELATRMSQVSGLEIVTDQCSPTILRYAVKNWDALDQFCSAQWGLSNRLLLMEIDRSSDRKIIRLRFILGNGPHEIRLRYYQTLVESGVPTTKKKEISSQWTRLATYSFVVGEDGSEASMEYEAAAKKIEEYAKNHIPQYDIALAKLKPVETLPNDSQN